MARDCRSGCARLLQLRGGLRSMRLLRACIPLVEKVGGAASAPYQTCRSGRSRHIRCGAASVVNVRKVLEATRVAEVHLRHIWPGSVSVLLLIYSSDVPEFIRHHQPVEQPREPATGDAAGAIYGVGFSCQW